MASKNFSNQSWGHTFSKIWDLIFFIGFIADFRFPTFSNFPRKKWVSKNVWEEFFWRQNFFRSFPRAHLFENLRFDIFYRFCSRFSIFNFFKFSKKKMGTQMNFFGNFFDFKKFFRSIPRAHLFENLRFDIFYRFYNLFSISHFWKFSKKKKAT